MRTLGPARRGGRAARFLAAALLALAAAAHAQPAQAQVDALPQIVPEKAENPYSRFEIVSLGSFPIMLFYAGFAFDLERYAANGFDYRYAPWPFKDEHSASLSDSERLARIGVALSASLVVGALDAYLHASKLKKAKRLRESIESPSP